MKDTKPTITIFDKEGQPVQMFMAPDNSYAARSLWVFLVDNLQPGFEIRLQTPQQQVMRASGQKLPPDLYARIMSGAQDGDMVQLHATKRHLHMLREIIAVREHWLQSGERPALPDKDSTESMTFEGTPLIPLTDEDREEIEVRLKGLRAEEQRISSIVESDQDSQTVLGKEE